MNKNKKIVVILFTSLFLISLVFGGYRLLFNNVDDITDNQKENITEDYLEFYKPLTAFYLEEGFQYSYDYNEKILKTNTMLKLTPLDDEDLSVYNISKGVVYDIEENDNKYDVIIHSSDNYKIKYSNLTKINVKKGDSIDAKETIGSIGASKEEVVLKDYYLGIEILKSNNNLFNLLYNKDYIITNNLAYKWVTQDKVLLPKVGTAEEINNFLQEDLKLIYLKEENVNLKKNIDNFKKLVEKTEANYLGKDNTLKDVYLYVNGSLEKRFGADEIDSFIDVKYIEKENDDFIDTELDNNLDKFLGLDNYKLTKDIDDDTFMYFGEFLSKATIEAIDTKETIGTIYYHPETKQIIVYQFPKDLENIEDVKKVFITREDYENSYEQSLAELKSTHNSIIYEDFEFIKPYDYDIDTFFLVD